MHILRCEAPPVVTPYPGIALGLPGLLHHDPRCFRSPGAPPPGFSLAPPPAYSGGGTCAPRRAISGGLHKHTRSPHSSGSDLLECAPGSLTHPFQSCLSYISERWCSVVRSLGLTQTKGEERKFALKVVWQELCHVVQNGTFSSFRLKSPYNIEWGQRSESRFDRRSLSGLMSEAPKVTRTLGREARGAKWEFR